VKTLTIWSGNGGTDVSCPSLEALFRKLVLVSVAAASVVARKVEA
jgi:hypothetical protein